MLMDALLALGLLVSTASQLRPAGSPIGPGEVCLAIWVFLRLCREVARLGPPLTTPLSAMMVFWLVFTVAQSIGTMTGYAIGDRHDPSLFMHDAMAYPLLAAVSCLCMVEPEAGARMRRVAWLLVTLGSVSLAVQIGKIWNILDILPIDPWYWDRFRGWSANPNQLALLCATLGLLSLHLADSATRISERVAAIACMVLPIYVGRLTKSDTFAIVLVGTCVLFPALKLRTWRLASPRGLTLRSAFAWLIILTLPALVGAGALLVHSISLEVKDVAREMAKGNAAQEEETASIRFHAWSEALRRGIDAGMLGLGPGPHIEIPFRIIEGRLTTVNEPKNVDHPKLNDTPNFEAHNTLLDLFTQSGVIGVLSVVGLAAVAMFATCRARLDGLTALLCGLAVFSTFHLIVRHPIFWFAVALCLVAGDAARRMSIARTPS